MRRDPTIGLARALSKAPILGSAWTIEADTGAPPGAKEHFVKHLLPAQLSLMNTALNGTTDYGWAPFEKVMALNSQGLIYVKKFKPLLVDLTDILVIEETGAFNGFENRPITGEVIELPLMFSLLFSNEMEGTDYYGEAIMRKAEDAYDKWETVDESASRYDKKIAGSHWVVHYPLGVSSYDGKPDVPNDVIANKILDSLESSGAIAVPRRITAVTEDLNEQSPDAWMIEILSDPGSSKTSFIDRQKYLDTLKIRAFEITERAVIEGQFGTKAEAEVHADIALENIEVRHEKLVEVVNWHVVNQQLRFNWGPAFENTVRVVPRPLSDPMKKFFKDLYIELMVKPESAAVERAAMDLEVLRQKLGVPVLPEEERVDPATLLPEPEPNPEPVPEPVSDF